MKAFTAGGYEVIACAPIDNDCDGIEDALAKINVKLIPLKLKRASFSPIADLLLIIRLMMLMRSHKITHVMSYTMKPVVYASLAAKIAGIKNIYSMITGLGYIFSADGLMGKMICKLSIFLLSCSVKCNTFVFFQNKDNLNDFVSFKIVKNINRTILINGSGICLEEFVPAPYPTDLVFLLVARFLKSKGVREFVSAAVEVKQRYPQARFQLVGWIDKNPDSISEDELQSWIESSAIEYKGRVTDIRPVITNASVFVLPSYSEGTPRSVLEAMAMSRPIITTDVPGCRETVIDGKNGFLVPKQNIILLAEAMVKFIQKPELIAHMGYQSRQYAEEKYNVHHVNNIILNSMEG
jgi:glycosyltransferase involved in cell wall biosynthesis